jgi:hypothetical protein
MAAWCRHAFVHLPFGSRCSGGLTSRSAARPRTCEAERSQRCAPGPWCAEVPVLHGLTASTRHRPPRSRSDTNRIHAMSTASRTIARRAICDGERTTGHGARSSSEASVRQVLAQTAARRAEAGASCGSSRVAAERHFGGTQGACFAASRSRRQSAAHAGRASGERASSRRDSNNRCEPYGPSRVRGGALSATALPVARLP